MKRCILGLCMALIGSAASAQEFYAGGSLDYLFPHSGSSETVAGVIGGVGLSTRSPFGYGAELEYGLRIAGGSDFDTQRFRVWGDYDLAKVSLRVAGGYTRYDFGSDDADGFNLGVGVERDFSQRITARGEFIRDFLDDNFTDAVTTTRVAVFYNF